MEVHESDVDKGRVGEGEEKKRKREDVSPSGYGYIPEQMQAGATILLLQGVNSECAMSSLVLPSRHKGGEEGSWVCDG
jgi:hypothetical protein